MAVPIRAANRYNFTQGIRNTANILESPGLTESVMTQPADKGERPTERITTLVSPRLLERIRREAQKETISVSAVVRRLLAASYPDEEKV